MSYFLRVRIVGHVYFITFSIEPIFVERMILIHQRAFSSSVVFLSIDRVTNMWFAIVRVIFINQQGHQYVKCRLQLILCRDSHFVIRMVRSTSLFCASKIFLLEECSRLTLSYYYALRSIKTKDPMGEFLCTNGRAMRHH